MTRASELAKTGAPDGTVVVADYQREGRGTRGRVWVAPPGTCLMFSAVLRPPLRPPELPGLPRRIAEAVAEAVNLGLGIDAGVKPPNDVIVGDRKLAGILCQSHIRSNRIRWLICGIGLNTNLTSLDAQVPDATSLLIETGLEQDHTKLIRDLLGALEEFRAPARDPQACPS